LGVIAIFLYVGVEVGVPAALISYLKLTGETGNFAGLDFSSASFIAGFYWLLMLVGRTIGSVVGGKVSSKTMVSVVASAAIVLMLLAMIFNDTVRINLPANWSFNMAEMPIATIFIVLVGLCTSVMWTSIFNMATEGLGKYTAKASGIFMMMVVGGGIVPLIQSAVAKSAGYMISYIVPILAVAYILFYALIGSKNVNKDIKID
jgi:FHS family L-fucose permease-like MFS transporter